MKVGQINPFTFKHTRAFRAAPVRWRWTTPTYRPLSPRLAIYGRVDSLGAHAAQTDIAYFWSENPYVHWNRNLTALAIRPGAGRPRDRPAVCMVQTAVSDTVIVGFDAKSRYGFWRPRTAIPQADTDGNPGTDARSRPGVRCLTVNHPEYPSGHGFWSTALDRHASGAILGTSEVTWTLTTSKMAVPAVVADLTHLRATSSRRSAEIFDARVWGGFPGACATGDGALIGGRVAAHVQWHHFQPTR